MGQGTALRGIPRRFTGLTLVSVIGLLVVGLTVAGLLLYYGRFGGDSRRHRSLREPDRPMDTSAFMRASSNGAKSNELPVDEAGHEARERLERELKAQRALMQQMQEELATRRQAPEPVARAPVSHEPASTGSKSDTALQRLKAMALHAKAPRLVINPEVKVDDVLSTHALRPGARIPFFVVSKVSSDVPGEFVGQVTQHVYASHDHRIMVIPAGATVVGKAEGGQLIPGNQRLPMSGVTLDFPGLPKPIDLGSLPVMDREGQIGMVDTIDHHYGRMAFGVIVGGFLRGSTRVIQSESGALGAVGALPSSLAQGTQQATQGQIQQLYDVRPSVTVEQGSRGYIFVTKPLTIPLVNARR